eukprot:CAMPEP_0170192770 /NCGR_PEP_ID=MMETSP0040_2-20121228/55160_1 /TAXON_ID=641309 /ORGANISM="Lotharella oceanica, Strain CCMP622" /LENGTH=51 /DNA_ID=CAMNT_0010441219 /DNA_START=276 /DNA_END=431 /DNA_ORIENTATION=-
MAMAPRYVSLRRTSNTRALPLSFPKGPTERKVDDGWALVQVTEAVGLVGLA